MQDEVLSKLKEVPAFRERRNRNHFLTILALRHLKIVSGAVKSGDDITVKIEQLKLFGGVYGSYERLWRQTLEKNIDLRGADYDTKTEYEQEKQLDLGYIPGFEQAMKDLEKITIKELPISSVNENNADKLHSNI